MDVGKSVNTIDLLDVDNYATWEIRMKFLLITRGLWSAVVGNEDVDSVTDQKALALIGLCVKEHHLTTLKRCSTAKEAWEQLEGVYQAKSNARKLQLKRELTQLRMESSEPLTKYVARAKDIQDQLRAASYEIADQEVAWAVLAGLPTEYEMMVTVLTATETEMKLDDILPKLLQVEQRVQKYERPEEKALIAMRGGGFGSRGKKYSKGGHNDQDRDAHKTCYYCGKVGHIQRNCVEKRRQSAGRHGKQMLAKFSSAIAF